MKALTVKQPWASLIVAGVKDVENRTWAVPSTLPQYRRCPGCNARYQPGFGWQCPGSSEDGMGHAAVATVADGPFPFRLAIHAGKRHDGNEFRRALLRATRLAGWGEPGNTMEWIRGWWANRDGIGGYGALIGTVLVTGCHHADECGDSRPYCNCSEWAEPYVYHWTLADPIEFAEPIPMRGRQGLWTVPDDALEAVQP